MFEHPFCASPDMDFFWGGSSENSVQVVMMLMELKQQQFFFFKSEQSVSGQLCMHHLAVWVTCI